MSNTNAYAAYSPTEPLKAFDFNRREVGAHDVQIEILYCGVCHSDIHTVRGEWGPSYYPIVPGHEIVGRITAVGNHVKNFAVGDLAGVGCIVDSCRECDNCKQDLEQFCFEGMTGTYGGYDRTTKEPTQGGYSTQIVVDEKYTLKVSDKLPLEGVAPLLCAGITTYSPLKYVGVKPGQKVAVVGLGGLGHMAVKFAAAFGAEVTMLSTSPNKEADAKKLGAHNFALTTNPENITALANTFDVILNTISAPHEYNTYLSMLKTNGTMIVVGVPPEPSAVPAFTLIMNRRSVIGSLIGGIAETQEMLDFCAENNIVSDVEVINMDYINKAYDRILKSDVKYRFVIDLASLKK